MANHAPTARILVSNAGMTNSPTRSRFLAATLAAALAGLAGCASQYTMEQRYDQSLQRWMGATRADLVKAWGKPLLDQAFLNEETLTWTVVDDIRTPQPMATYATPNGGAPIVLAPTIAPTVPSRCTTHFALRGGVVVGWKFEGLACGAPQ
jgi:hypothetical protein